jgi:putative photosynthetic complex assembly protein
MSDAFEGRPFPRAPLVAAALLLGGVMLAVATVRVTGIGAERVADAPTVSERALRFEDRDDGSIVVFDSASNAEVTAIAPGTNGFLRSTLRGLVRERKRQGFGPEQPFRLVGRADGRLTLVDPATGRRVDLESFGPTNAAVFAQLMTPKAAPQ